MNWPTRSFAWFVSLRYLRPKRKQRFISLITLISILGVAVGVLALIVVMSVWSGFTEGLRDQIIGINAHVQVQRFGGIIPDTEGIRAKIQATKGVEAVTPYIYGQALISSTAQSTGVFLRGIEAASASTVLNIGHKMYSGQLSDLDRPTDVPPILLGRDMARQLQVGVGDRVRLLAPNGPLSPMGILPKVLACVVTGIFETGMSEYDAAIAYINLETARSVTDLRWGVHGIEVRVRDIDQASLVAANIRQTLGSDYSVRDWQQQNQNLFAALKLEKAGIFIALDLIILVAALNIISALIMMVMEKNRDIAILKSMGATTRHIMRIFFYQGLVIGLIGTVLGTTAGLTICALLKRYKFIELPPKVYPMSTLPIKVELFDVTLIALSALLITLIATLYPSWKASRIRPAEALSYE